MTDVEEGVRCSAGRCRQLFSLPGRLLDARFRPSSSTRRSPKCLSGLPPLRSTSKMPRLALSQHQGTSANFWSTNHALMQDARSSRRTPTSVTVHPVALFSILDHYLRRTDAQDRVIGTLLGTRSDNGEVDVRSSFAVLHSETAEQVAVDMEYHRTMYELHHKVNPKEVIVGWCVVPSFSACVTLSRRLVQVLDRVQPEHLLCPHPKLLFSRNRSAPSHSLSIEHGC